MFRRPIWKRSGRRPDLCRKYKKRQMDIKQRPATLPNALPAMTLTLGECPGVDFEVATVVEEDGDWEDEVDVSRKEVIDVELAVTEVALVAFELNHAMGHIDQYIS